MNHRRKLLIAFGASAFSASFSSFAQQPGKPPEKIRRIGLLTLANFATASAAQTAFVQALRELGYVEGKNLVIDRRSAESDHQRLPGLAAELVQLKPDVIVAAGNDASFAMQAATTTIPVVMPSTSDPVGNRIIKSLARPGGNITGISDLSTELGPKRLEMLLTITASPASSLAPTAAPKVSRVAVLVNFASPGNANALKNLLPAGPVAGVTLVPFDAPPTGDLDKAFASMRQQHAGGVIVLPNPFLIQQSGQIAQLAAKYRLPVIAAYRIYAEAGGLMTYGSDLNDNFRRAATFVDKIFKGAKPADLPVEQPTTFELVINGKTAKALGMKIPQALLISADKVIE